MAKPPPVAAPVPPSDDEEDNFNPGADAPEPPKKAGETHPVGGNSASGQDSKPESPQGGNEARSQGSKPESPQGGNEARSQGSKWSKSQTGSAGQGEHSPPKRGKQGPKEPSSQGGNEARSQDAYPSWNRPKLGTRVDAWLKQTLKIAAAMESRPEERLVEDALTAYLYQRHPQLVTEVKAHHGTSST